MPNFLNPYKYYIYGGLLLVFIILVVSTYFTWKHSIETAALAAFNKAQIEQSIKDQKEYDKKLEEVKKLQDKTVAELEAKNKLFEDKIKALATYLDSAEAKKNNRASSIILKKTIEQLSKEK